MGWVSGGGVVGVVSVKVGGGGGGGGGVGGGMGVGVGVGEVGGVDGGGGVFRRSEGKIVLKQANFFKKNGQ